VWATGDLMPGDAILFHCMTIHRAFDNRSASRIRLSVDFRYQPQSDPVNTVHQAPRSLSEAASG